MEYTCKDYRAEMQLLSLRRRLEQEESLNDYEKEVLKVQIDRIEKEMGMR
jgi:hypothetical protein